MKVHVYDDRLVCYLGVTEVLELPRVHRPRGGTRHETVIDYRHIISALMRKPQAFRHHVHRDALYPRTAFRRAWEAVDAGLDERRSCRVYVGLLHLAATQACEARLAGWLDEVLDRGELPDLEAARLAMAPPTIAAPILALLAPDVRAYDGLISMTMRAA